MEKKNKPKGTKKNQKPNCSMKGQINSLELEIQDLKDDVKRLKMKRDQCKRKYEIMQQGRNQSREIDQ